MMSDVVYVSVPEVTDTHSAKYIVPNRIYKGVSLSDNPDCYCLEGIIDTFLGEFAEVFTCLTESAWLDGGDWDIRTEEEYLYQELTNLKDNISAVNITANDIGKKVVSEFFGIGVITHFDEHCKYPVGVMFNCFKYPFKTMKLKKWPDCYYTVKGWTYMLDRPECNIKLLESCDE